jgi:hypothetical protein
VLSLHEYLLTLFESCLYPDCLCTMSLVLVWISTFLALTHGVEVLSEVDTRDITLVVPAVLPGTWKYQGCFADQEPRTLGASSYKSYNMTIENCIAYCGTAEYTYAGVKHSACCELPISQLGDILHSRC